LTLSRKRMQKYCNIRNSSTPILQIKLQAGDMPQHSCGRMKRIVYNVYGHAFHIHLHTRHIH
jgi:hypothetical protein